MTTLYHWADLASASTMGPTTLLSSLTPLLRSLAAFRISWSTFDLQVTAIALSPTASQEHTRLEQSVHQTFACKPVMALGGTAASCIAFC